MLSHVLVLALIVTMVNLGLWQLHRLDERRDTNARIEARGAEPVAALTDLVAPTGSLDTAGAVQDRIVTATGRYEGRDVVVRNRSLDGQPGAWVLTPLRLEDGSTVVVNRGFVPIAGEQPVPVAASAPPGTVEVTGSLQPTQERGRFGPKDPATGVLERIARVDLERLDAQIDGPVHPVWIQLVGQVPAPAEFPVPVPPPARGDGPHLGYAVQWFVFSLIALCGYPLVLRRVARRQMESVPDA